MDIMIGMFCVAFVGGILAAIYKASQNKKHKQNAQAIFDSLPDFKANAYYLSESSGQSIGFDDVRKKICFLDKFQKNYVYDYSKILQCELMIDGETMLKQSTTGTIGRAVLGGVLTGGVGAIIGGATATKTEKQKINSIDLKVIINDTVNPAFKINFLSIKTQKNSLIYKNAYAQAEKWHAILSGLIRQGNAESDREKHTPQQQTDHNIADELIKLKGLVDSGLLTHEEFQKQKTKLMA